MSAFEASFVICGIVVVTIMLCCISAIWWDLLECTSFISEKRDQRRFRSLLKKAAIGGKASISSEQDLIDGGDSEGSQLIKITITEKDGSKLQTVSYMVTKNENTAATS